MVLCFVAGSFAEVAAVNETTLCIAVHGEAQVVGDRILLGQVAEISGGTEALCRKLSDIDLGPAPRPGRERRVPGRSVESALASCGQLPGGIRTTIPDWIVVTGAYQTLSEASLEEVFKTYIERQTGRDETVVSRIRIRGLKPLPLGNIALSPSGRGDAYIKGNVSLRLGVAVDGKDHGQVTISGWVDRYARVVCATTAIPMGSVIKAADVCLKRMNISKASSRILFDIAQVVGKEARSQIRVGDCLQEHRLTTPPLIEKGDRVKILARAGVVRVATMGIAKADGAEGEQIRVENIASEKTVVGRVVDGGTVEVLF
jgi:flagella basal body P-ring formation protein FlgA